MTDRGKAGSGGDPGGAKEPKTQGLEVKGGADGLRD